MESFAVSKSDDGVHLALTASMDIRAAEPLLHAMQEAAGSGAKVVVDASVVDRLSTPCVQVLLSGLQQMEEAGTPFVIKSPTDAFVSAFDDLGLFSYLMKWPVQT